MINNQAQTQSTTASGVPAGAFVNPMQVALMPMFFGINPWSYANYDMNQLLKKFMESQEQYEEGEV